MFDMIDGFISNLLKLEATDTLPVALTYTIMAIIVLLIAFIADKIIDNILLKWINKIVAKTKTKIDDSLVERKIFKKLAHIAPALVVYGFSYAFVGVDQIIRKVCLAYIVVIVAIVLLSGIDVINDIYNSKAYYSKNRPIKGLLQVVKIFVVVLVVLTLIAVITDSATAFALLGGIGGVSAVLILIFKDSILGLVAGVQLSADNLLALGDWISMDKYGADGEVVDIALTKIVVRNWDKTYVTIPAYRFLEDSFTNWKGMSQAGGRRIKRSLCINMKSIKFLKTMDIERLRKIHILTKYLDEKMAEIKAFNETFGEIGDNIANGRHLTNIGTFRAYMELYLKDNPKLHHEGFTLMVRQLAPTDKGVPIEVYCFANDTNWVHYEAIQADIFDHMLAVINEFDLKVYQAPSGDDLMKLVN